MQQTKKKRRAPQTLVWTIAKKAAKSGRSRMTQVHGTILGLKSNANKQMKSKEKQQRPQPQCVQNYKREKRIDENEMPSSESIAKSFIQRQTGATASHHMDTIICIPARRSKGKRKKETKASQCNRRKRKGGHHRHSCGQLQKRLQKAEGRE